LASEGGIISALANLSTVFRFSQTETVTNPFCSDMAEIEYKRNDGRELRRSRIPTSNKLALEVKRMELIAKQDSKCFCRANRMQRRRIRIRLAPHERSRIDQQPPAELTQSHQVLSIAPAVREMFLIEQTGFANSRSRKQNAIANDALYVKR